MAKKHATRNTGNAVAVCQPKYLPAKQRVAAAKRAAAINPVNQPAAALVACNFSLRPEFIAVLTTKYWGPAGVSLSVSFMDGPSKALRDRILSHMNAWGRKANVRFRYTASQGQVRIARVPGDGYWSYVGTDILSIPLYQIPGFLTKSGDPIVGGKDIVATDHTFTGRIYPKRRNA